MNNYEAQIADLQNTINQLNARISEMESTHLNELNSLKVESAVELELVRAGAKNLKAARGLVELPDGVKAGADGVVPGLAEAVAKIKSSDGYLFEDKTELKISGALPAESEGNLPDFSKMTYSQVSDFLAKNPGVDLGIGAIL